MSDGDFEGTAGSDLKIDGIAFPQPRFDLGNRTNGVSLEVVKVGNPLFVEERSCHRSMKPNWKIT